MRCWRERPYKAGSLDRFLEGGESLSVTNPTAQNKWAGALDCMYLNPAADPGLGPSSWETLQEMRCPPPPCLHSTYCSDL